MWISSETCEDGIPIKLKNLDTDLGFVFLQKYFFILNTTLYESKDQLFHAKFLKIIKYMWRCHSVLHQVNVRKFILPSPRPVAVSHGC